MQLYSSSLLFSLQTMTQQSPEKESKSLPFADSEIRLPYNIMSWYYSSTKEKNPSKKIEGDIALEIILTLVKL